MGAWVRELVGRPTWRIQDDMIKSDVGMVKEGELGAFSMSGSCRSWVLIQ
jgi:hypothetical protein